MPPLRNTTTPLAKSENVCSGCRSRKKKCDGKRPCCSSCLRRGEICLYRVSLIAPAWPSVADFNSASSLDFENVPSTTTGLLTSVHGGLQHPSAPNFQSPLFFPVVETVLEYSQPKDLASNSQISPSHSRSNPVEQLNSPPADAHEPGSLPPPSVLRELVDIFFERIYDYIPVVHRRRFLAELDNEGLERCSRALLFAICSVSAGRHTNPHIRELQRSWYDIAREKVSKSLHSPGDIVATLQATVIVIYQAIIFTEYSTSWLLVGDAWRIAVVTECARLDRSYRSTPLTLNIKMGNSWIKKEECRRALWMLFIFDRGLCSLDLALAIDDEHLNINLPMSDDIFAGEDDPLDLEPIAHTPNIDNLLDNMEKACHQGNTNIRQFIVVAHMLLGRIGNEIYQSKFDYTKNTSILDSLSASLVKLRLLIPKKATEFAFADPREFNLVVWLNATMTANAIFLYHQPLLDGESFDEPSGMSRNWPHCVAASRNLAAGLRDICRSSTDFAHNAFLASLVYASSRILVIEYVLSPSDTASQNPANALTQKSRSQSLRADLDLLSHVFRHFKEALGGLGAKFYNAFIYFMTVDEERSRAAKASTLLDMLRLCDRWPSQDNAESLILP